MPSLDQQNEIRRMLASVQQGIAGAVGRLDAAWASGNPDIKAIGECAYSVEYAGFVAEMAGLEGLRRLSVTLSDYLFSLRGDVAVFTEAEGQRLLQWVESVRLYIQQPDMALIEELLEPLPENLHEALFAVLMNDTRQGSALLSSMTDEHAGFLQVAEMVAPQESMAAEVAPIVDDAVEANLSGLDVGEQDEPDHAQIVQQNMSAAQEGLGNALAVLLQARADGGDEHAAFEDCISQVDFLAVVAEVAVLPELQQASLLLADYMRNKAAVPSDFDMEDVERLIAWSEDVDAYVHQPDDNELMARLFLPVQTYTADPDLLVGMHAPEGDAANPSVIETAPDVLPEFPIWALGTTDADGESAGQEPEGILGVLWAELSEAAVDLSGMLEIIAAPEQEPDILALGVQQYTDIVGRVAAVCEGLGLKGLHDTCAFINENVTLIGSLEPQAKENMRVALEGWPSLVLSYLEEPADDDRCIALVDYLQSPAWAAAMNDTTARELIGALAEQPIFSDEFGEEEVRQTVATAEDVALEISADVSQELINAFFHESPGHAAEITERVTQAVTGNDVQENIAAAQRLAHTLKGSANLIGAKGLANLTHHLEDIFEYLARHRMTPPAALASTLQESTDCIEAMIDALQGKDIPPADAQQIMQNVLDWANRLDAGQVDESTVMQSPAVESLPEGSPDRAAIQNQPAETNDNAAQAVLRIPTHTVDDMFRLMGEMSISIGQIREQLKRVLAQGESLRTHDATLQHRRFELESMVDFRSIASMQQRMRRTSGDAGDDGFDPLEMDQYSDLYGTAHSFIETVSDSRAMALQLQSQLAMLDSLFVHQQRINNELQQTVMTTRMVPVNSITARLQRSVRQAARATGKDVELEIQGADMMVDVYVLEKLADPIMHMLRNAVDHGIETAEEREAQGKPSAGKVTLQFSKDGNNLVLRCADDGRGLNYARIRETAVERGLLDAKEQLDQMSLGRLILAPGFSTRTTATQISGRGVGMDVVNSTIQKLKGNLEIADNPHGGTLFTLRMPTTLVTNHAVLVKVQGVQYAVPTNSLVQILSPGMGEYTLLGADTVFRLGKEVYKARPLAELLGMDGEDRLMDASKTTLLVRADTGLIAVAIDQAVNSYDLVVKNTGRYVANVQGVLGVSVLGDGNVVAMLNLPELLRERISRAGTSKKMDKAVTQTVISAPRILIVDDSLSVRNSLARLIQDAGFEAVTARDGLEAIDAINKVKPALVLTDMEMPRMNGLELSSYIRSHAEISDLPVIMITSRSMQKHREQADKVGVDVYITKPYTEDNLMQQIGDLLNAA